MAGAPLGSKRLVGLTDCGVDAAGDHVFFGFKISATEEAIFETHHEGLAGIIQYLQAVAYQARQRRLKVNPASEHTETLRTPHNPLYSVQFVIDVAGQHVMLMGTTTDGLPLEVQIPFVILRGIERDLPSILETMRNRQASRGKQQ
jgi:hypothetical protein